MRNIFIFFILFIFSFSLVLAYSSYPYGYFNDAYSDTSGFWNAELNTDDVTFTTKGITDALYTPIIDDIDNDGIDEIIITTGTGIKIYEGITLENEDAILTSPTSNIVLNDFDDDGLDEIVFFDYKQKILHIHTWNDTDMTDVLTENLSSSFPSVWEYSTIGCNNEDECIFIAGNGAETHTNIISFDDTGSKVAINYTFSSAKLCGADSKNIFTLSDYDEDGEQEFIFAARVQNDIGSHYAGMLYINVLDNVSIPFVENLYQADNLDTTPCSSIFRRHTISNVVVTDFDDFPSNGLESVIATADGSGNVIITALKSDGSLLDEYPQFLTITTPAEGYLVSNLVLGDFDNAGQDEVCVMALDDITDSAQTMSEVGLVCATESGSWFDGEVFGNIQAPYNITRSLWSGSSNTSWLSIHRVNYNQSNVVDEILSPYGVIQLYEDRSAIEELSVIWATPKQLAAHIPFDIEDFNLADMILLQDSNLWAYNDGFSNSDCSTQNCLGAVSTNPSINSVIKENTTFHVSVPVTDVDGDLVNAKVIIYEGTPNEQDTGWSNNASSGSTLSFTTLKVNLSGSNFIMKVQGREQGNPAEVDEKSFTFSVASEGAEFGDSTFTETEEEEETAAADGEDTAVSGVMDDLETHTNLGSTTIWLILMALVPMIGAYLYIKAGSGYKDLTTSFIFVGIIEVFLLVLGVRFGFIGIVWVITLAILSLLFLGIWVSKIFTGGNDS